MDIQAAIQAHLGAAAAICDLAEKAGRGFTDEERAKVAAHMGEARLLKKQAAGDDPEAAKAKQKASDAAMSQAIMDLGAGGDMRQSAGASGRKAGGPWATAFMKGLPYQPATGKKDLLPVAGSVSVGQLSPTIGTLDDGARVQTILQLIPVQPATGDAFSYLRETARTNNAAPVAPGARKPESIYTLERISDRIRTIAHLSEPIPRNWLSDAEMLQSYLDMTLRDGVIQELEYQIIQGSGADEDLPGILNTAGVLVQGFDTNIIVTTRKALTVLETRPVTATGWLFHPEDWETVELATASGSGEFLIEGSPVNRARRQLWGLPVALSLGIPAGTALLADWRTAVALLEREGVRVDWSESFLMPATDYGPTPGTGFQHNMVQFRAEGRWGLSINRPGAIVEVDLEAGS